jgi:hypothetical protein
MMVCDRFVLSFLLQEFTFFFVASGDFKEQLKHSSFWGTFTYMYRYWFFGYSSMNNKFVVFLLGLRFFDFFR